MTSLTMYDSWTAPTMLSLWDAPATTRTKVARQVTRWVGVIDTTVTVLCPVAVSLAAIFAASVWPEPTSAAPATSAATTVATPAAPATR
ncbi:hypothetical protein ACXDF8_08375 [Mycolicibacterium sp. CBM1]